MTNETKPSFELKYIILRLVGPVYPLGSHNEDMRRLENIKALTALIDELLDEVADAAQLKSRPEASINQIARHADEYLKQLGKNYEYD